ncbi:MAG TPA: hypothetical protein VH440_02880 [Candidatus Limnocylindrales bacterium]|jgi:hypothetical protein
MAFEAKQTTFIQEFAAAHRPITCGCTEPVTTPASPPTVGRGRTPGRAVPKRRR